jgi:hypothetical protein
MRNSFVVGASMVALGAAFSNASAGPIGAPRVLTTNVADYNAAKVTTAANGILTVPASLATYDVNGNGGTLEVNSRLTITLPSNFTFNSQPSLSTTGTATFTLVAGGIGAQSAVFQVNTAPVVPGQSVSLGGFAVQGVTALETPIPVPDALPLTMQSTANSEITNNDPIPFSKGAFASEPGATAIFVGAIQFVDLMPPSFGSMFLSNPDSLTAVIAATAIQAETVDALTMSVPVLNPNGTLNSLSTSDTATVTIPGLFSGIKTGFASTTSDCKSPITDSSQPAAALQLTIPDVPINREIFFCVTAIGDTLLQQNPNGFSENAAPGTSTDFLAVNAIVEFPGFWLYTGGGVVPVTNFFTGDDAGYSSVLRVNNAGTSSVQLFVVAQPDTGGPQLIGPLGPLDAGMGTVFSEGQVATATGMTLANSGQRATLQLIIGGNSVDVAASSILVNPSGVVDNVGLAKPVTERR